MIVAGTNAVAGANSIAIPAHQKGDLIYIFARTNNTSGTNTVVPAAPGGNVPMWTEIQKVTAATMGYTIAVAVAVNSSLESGSWNFGTAPSAEWYMSVLVLRPDAGKQLLPGKKSNSSNLSAVAYMTYPAMQPSTLDGTSWIIRTMSRKIADDEVAIPQAGYTNRIAFPGGAGCVMAVHTQAGVTANLTQDTINITATAAQYIGGSIEVREEIAPSPPPANILLYDNFNRPDDLVYAGAGADLWLPTNKTGAASAWRVVSNRLDALTAAYHSGFSAKNHQADFDFIFEKTSLETAAVGIKIFWAYIPGTDHSGCRFDINNDESVSLFTVTNAADTYIGASNPSFKAYIGTQYWVSVRGSLIAFYKKLAGDDWRVVGKFTNATYNRPGKVGLEWYGSYNFSWDNFYLDPIYTIPLKSVVVI